MFCRQCGKEIKEGNKFCTGCGATVILEDMEIPEVTFNEEENSQNSQPEFQTFDCSEEKPKKKGPIVLIIVVIVILILAASGAAFWFAGGDQVIYDVLGKNKEKTEESQELKEEEETEEGVLEDAEVTDSQEEVEPAEEAAAEEEPAEEEEVEEPAEEVADEESAEELLEATGEIKDHKIDAISAADEKKSEYLIADSDKRKLTKRDLEGFSAEECRIARNELYARHGRMFDTPELQEYFNSCSWYVASITTKDWKESMLNEVETYNRDFIVTYEKEMGYR